jgi:uncharacterized protein YecA (UPF0149 family)
MNTQTGEIADINYFRDKVKSGEMSNAEFDKFIKPIDIENLSKGTQQLLLANGRTIISRNSRCPCGSGKRFKRCCMTK